MHDFNPGIRPSGLFWIVQVPDDAVQISDDAVTIHLENVAVADNFFFAGPGNVPSSVSFDITYTKSAEPRRVRPTSRDPLSPFNWAGEMSPATNSGTFSVAYNDGSFSAQGSFSSSGSFGEIGTERNGSFVEHGEENEEAAVDSFKAAPINVEHDQMAGNATAGRGLNSRRTRVPRR